MTGFNASMATYSQGFAGGLSVRGENLVSSHPGKVFWVAKGSDGTVAAYPNRKGASDGNLGTFLAPYQSVDYAIGRCVADRGDIIMVLPGYAQAVAAADGFDVDVDGVSIIGIGQGDKQPAFTLNATASECAVGADNVSLDNLHFISTVTVCTVGLDVEDGSDDYRISNCRWSQAASATLEFAIGLRVVTSDRGVIEGCDFDSTTADGAVVAVQYKGACLGGTFRHNVIKGAYSTACVNSITAAPQELLMHDNVLINGQFSGLETVACVSMLTGTTGYAYNNQLFTNVASPLTGAWIADAMFFGGGNTVSVAVETAGLPLEGGQSPLVRMNSISAIDDGTDGLKLFTVLGEVWCHGFIMTAEVGASNAPTVGLQLDATVSANDRDIIAVSDVIAATEVGDVLWANVEGATWTFAAGEAVGDDTVKIFDSPILIPAGDVEWSETGGTPGTLQVHIEMFWSEATPGATVTTSTA